MSSSWLACVPIVITSLAAQRGSFSYCLRSARVASRAEIVRTRALLAPVSVNVCATASSLPSLDIPSRPSDCLAIQRISRNTRRLASHPLTRDHCEACHQPKGEGIARIYPPLVNNESITMRNSVNAIRIVLNGGFPPSTEGNPRPYGMPPFYQDLSNEQVAAVVTYIRQSWGNNAPPTLPFEVQRSRGVPTD